MTFVVVAIAVVTCAVGLAVVLGRRTGNDGVDSFRRQIDALSPEARKPTIDQVKSAERDGESADEESTDGDT